MSESKNPFSLYDFLGYFIPGAFMLFVLHIFLESAPIETPLYGHLKGLNIAPFLGNDPVSLNSASFVAYVIASYIIGHMVSYTSAMTIEYFSNIIFGYPSKYLLDIQDKNNKNIHILEKILGNELDFKCLIRLFAFLFFLPVTFPMFVFFHSPSIKGYLTRRLDKQLITSINNKIKDYCHENNFDLPNKDGNQQYDQHRMIMHYVTVNIPSALNKGENYIALYGFLRSITLVFSISTLLVTGMSIHSSIALIQACQDISIDYKTIIYIVLLEAATIISYLGYLKFYRRYTLENFMSFLVHPRWATSMEVAIGKKQPPKKNHTS